MKDPAILFYTQDFLIGSSLLNATQKGHYITLLCYQQQSETGSLSISEIESLMKPDFKKHWHVLSKKFKQDNNGFYNERMRKEIERRRQHSVKQKENVAKRWSKSGNTTVIPRYQNGKELVIPLETATEIVNRDLPAAKNLSHDVEKDLSENQIEFERICMGCKKSKELAKQSLHKFHLHLIEKDQYPKTKRSLFAGFEKWLLNEKNVKEDQNEQQTNQNFRLKKIS